MGLEGRSIVAFLVMYLSVVSCIIYFKHKACDNWQFARFLRFQWHLLARAPRCKMIVQSRRRAALHENVEAFLTDLLEDLVGRLDFTWAKGGNLDNHLACSTLRHFAWIPLVSIKDFLVMPSQWFLLRPKEAPTRMLA